MFGSQAPTLPTDLLERQFLPFLQVRSLLRLARCSKTCRAALSNDTASIDVLFWKERYRRRWKTSKSALTGDDADNNDDDDDDDESHGVPAKWYAAYKRRHLLDATVRKKLRSPHHGASASKDPAWKYLLVDGGLNIVDRLYTFASDGNAGSRSVVTSIQSGDEFVTDLGTVDNFERDVALSALVAINRIDVVSRWQKLVSPEEPPDEPPEEQRVPSVSINIEDGAKLLARFYVGTQRAVDAFSGGQIDNLESTIDTSLNRLAHKLCLRLLARYEHISEAEAIARHAVTDEACGQFISLSKCEDYQFSHRNILEEMQHIFRGTGGENGTGMRGNAEDYYSYQNSLLDQVLDKGLGIPITLSVTYAAVVRRAVGVVLDPVGLPGHFVLATPSSDDNASRQRLFIDAFRGGEILSLDDVQHIVASYQIPWDDSFLRAVPYKDVWTRMVRNLRACHQRNTILDLFNEDNPARRAMGDHGFAGLLRRVPPQELTDLQYQHAMSLSIGMFMSSFIESLDIDSMVMIARPVFDRTICCR